MISIFHLCQWTPTPTRNIAASASNSRRRETVGSTDVHHYAVGNLCSLNPHQTCRGSCCSALMRIELRANPEQQFVNVLSWVRPFIELASAPTAIGVNRWKRHIDVVEVEVSFDCVHHATPQGSPSHHRGENWESDAVATRSDRAVPACCPAIANF